MKNVAFKIVGMDCAEEVSTLKKELEPLPGVSELNFDIFSAKMTVGFDEGEISVEQLIVAVERTGMQARAWSDSQSSEEPTSLWGRYGRTTLTAASGLFTVTGYLCHATSSGLKAAFSDEASSVPIVAKVLYLAAIVAGVWFVLPKAWLALRRFRPDMNLLMVVAVLGAITINQWLEGATVAFLFALSMLLEAWSVGRARNAVAALMAVAPPQARVLHAESDHHVDSKANAIGSGVPSQHEHLTALAEVAIGSTVLVKPGERFPLDGKISVGETHVNQAPITGESEPVAKAPGSEVFAGSINGDGTVEVVTTKLARDTTIARIVRLVGEAQSRRSPSEQWVEQFARYYTPLVMVAAVAVMLVPPLLLGGDWSKWFYEGLVLLVIACPCALVISTPVSIVAAMASAAKNGVLIKGGLFVEVPARLRCIALDKTGTLTSGTPTVLKVVPLSGHTERELLEISAAIEARSEHPLARAILAAAEASGIRPQPADAFQAIKGKGASARLNGQEVWIGSHRYLESRGQETAEMHEQLEALASAGSSVVVIGNNEHVCGFIAVADPVRPSAKATIEALRATGIQNVVMLTGDNGGTANVVGHETGVDEIRAELLPEQKVAAIEELVQRYGQVAMVGDGVNDAPAMALATIGIAMGAAGSDAAIETADIALMSDDLSRLPWLIGHSRRTMTIIRQNITASLLVKAAFVGLTLFGHASLWAAIAADTGMSLAVVFNALRLLRS